MEKGGRRAALKKDEMQSVEQAQLLSGFLRPAGVQLQRLAVAGWKLAGS